MDPSQEQGLIPPEDNKNYYPSLFDLSFLTLPAHTLMTNSSSNTCPPSKRELPSPTTSTQPTPKASSLEIPTVSPPIDKDNINHAIIEATTAPSKLSSQSSWYYVRPVFINNQAELNQHVYKSLSPYIVKKTYPIHCNILVFDHDEEEIIFFHRLTKIFSQKLFSTRLEILSSSVKINFESLSPLCLSPLSFAKKLNPQACFHQVTLYQHISWLPTYSSFQYDNDPQLRQHLWSILKQQPFAYTRKS